MQPGDVYSFCDEQLDAYAACQITHIMPAAKLNQPNSYAVLTLHWSGSKLPTLEELRQIKPLVVNFYYWDDEYDHTITEGPIPSDYTYIGQLPVHVQEESRSYGWWHRANQLHRQLQWERIPAHRREASGSCRHHASLGHTIVLSGRVPGHYRLH